MIKIMSSGILPCGHTMEVCEIRERPRRTRTYILRIGGKLVDLGRWYFGGFTRAARIHEAACTGGEPRWEGWRARPGSN